MVLTDGRSQFIYSNCYKHITFCKGSCDFENHTCGWKDTSDVSYHWKWQMANITSIPGEDHTTGSSLGHVMHIDGNQESGFFKKADLEYAVDKPGALGCQIGFWYHIYDKSGSSLSSSSLKVIILRGTTEKTLLEISKSQTTGWENATAFIGNQPGGYKLLFSFTPPFLGARDIMLDDVRFENCGEEDVPVGSNQLSCDFEKDTCSWYHDYSSSLLWERINGQFYEEPKGNGYYMIIRTKYNIDISSAARLISFPRPAGQVICVSFWYHIFGNSIGSLRFIAKPSGEPETVVWMRSGTQGNKWRFADLTFNSDKPIQVIFEAVVGDGPRKDIAIDDLTVFNGACPPQGFCDFETDFCGWVNYPPAESGVDWDWLSGDSKGTFIPRRDHSTGTSLGHFAFFIPPESNKEEIAQLQSEKMEAVDKACLEFWHYTQGWSANRPSVITLTVFVNDTAGLRSVWNTSGYMNNTWIQDRVDYRSSGPHQIILQASCPASKEGSFALDDVHIIRNESCHDIILTTTPNPVTMTTAAPASAMDCSFEQGLCSWVQEDSDDFNWSLTSGYHIDQPWDGPLYDHTVANDRGFYMTVKLSDFTQTEVAQLITPEYHSGTEMCVRFWYWLPAESSNGLSIHLLLNGEESEALWERSGVPSTDWEVAQVTVSSPAKFHMLKPVPVFHQVVFKAYHVPGMNTTVKIDDIYVSDGACTPPANCDFESGQCSLVNILKENGHDWVMANGGFQGPSTDHTTQTPEGWFLLSSALHQNHSSLAHVVSQWIQLKDAPSCFTLWYHMDSSDSGTLRVYMRTGPSEEVLMNNSNSSGQRWRKFSQSVERIKPFQLLIEAETYNTGFIAIDDMSLTPGVCQGNETSLGFVDCSLENGTCGWEDNSVGQFQWVRGRNGTEDTGPSVDHTLGTELGWYMSVESAQGDQMSPAALQSPTFRQASTTCTLHFYYNMYGEDTEDLNVVLKEGARTTTLWWLSGNHGDLWQHGEVTVGRIPLDFSILFEASRTFSKPGHIAIDDIAFANCTLPEAQPSCPQSSFVCNNSVCVEYNQVCDFSDDCGDWSDENNCEQQGVVERCSFEQGLCSWAESDVDTPGAEWTHHTGQEAWPKNGPPRDHTQNSAAGHYVIPGPHLTEKGQAYEILSKTLLPSSNCTVRFFYFSLDIATSRLTARSRTLRSGSGDRLLWLRENSQSYSWQRAEVTLTSSASSKIVFRYEHEDGRRGLVALDDISFSKECAFDPDNNELPDTSPTSAVPTSSNTPTSPPSTSISTPPVNPCQDKQFFCWRSDGKVCIPSTLKCDYHPDCPQGEDEDGCGPCTFEMDQCQWTDTSDGQSKWQRQKANNNTEPPTDHTTETGKYIYIKSSPPSVKGNMAQLKSSLLPPAGEKGYCVRFWYHMYGATVGFLRMHVQTVDPFEKTLVWQKSGNQEDEWLLVQTHVMLQKVHQVVLEATVGGEAGDIAIDDISFISGPCPASDLCDFEEGSCNWQQQTSDDFDWVRQSGTTHNPNTGPDSDHTTNTPTGYYYYVPSSTADRAGQTATMFSPLYPAGKGSCLQLWYHMYGKGMGTLNIYQQSEDGKKALIYSQTGDQGRLWRFAQASLLPRIQTYRIVVESVKAGPTREGDMAFDDVQLTDSQCPAQGFCDFENNMCSWSNVGGEVDQGDWLRSRGASPNPNTGPSADHTTNSTHGYYLYVDSSVGKWGDMSFLVSDVFHPSTRGHCLKFWYHMYGSHVGTLRVHINDRKMHTGGSEEGILKWIESGNKGDKWQEASVSIKHEETFWFVFVYQRGMNTGGDVALDDITIFPGECYSGPPTDPPDYSHETSVGLAVGLTLLVGLIISILLFILNRKHRTMYTEV
ncbi:MAM and LDL-receptor class A domain-containing protein 1 [Channa argus]|uniref:MAM and LDL-receptor class A domain-containing protein 1 n=1 Tax=Channa argus TaxID=215402 RepID=A0A6G1Q8Q3_CHAAH|nr:MAM and LDL-receptor class A domain-containing protein 1 [Channa argus]